MKNDGRKLRCLSKNKLYIGVARNGNNLLCFYEGNGKPSSRETLNAFLWNIHSGPKIVHDGDNSNRKLIATLGLSETHTTKETQGLKDDKTPHPHKPEAQAAQKIPERQFRFQKKSKYRII